MAQYFECRKCLQKSENFSIQNSVVKMGKMGKCLILDWELSLKKNFMRVCTKSKHREWY